MLEQLLCLFACCCCATCMFRPPRNIVSPAMVLKDAHAHDMHVMHMNVYGRS